MSEPAQEEPGSVEESLEKEEDGEPKVSILNFEKKNPEAALINSPRSLKACWMEGVVPKELVFIPSEKMKKGKMAKEVVEVRFDYYENKRKTLLKGVKKTREALIKQQRRWDKSS